MRIVITIIIIIAIIALLILAIKPSFVYRRQIDQLNPMEGKKVIFVENSEESINADGVCGHLEAIGISSSQRSLYDKIWKRLLDIILSSVGLVILSPLFVVLCIAILIDDPGPIFFCQKRIGINKQYFKLHKFRTMKMCTPHDVPTHMLENPEQYITRVGKLLRKLSLDEIPQLIDILVGTMSTIGPRPALWNQDVLTAERDKYGANNIKPGLTGWAQINGRDELEIPIKAELDGFYSHKLQEGGIRAFFFDCRCFFGTILSVAKSDGVVEGGTGAIDKNISEKSHDMIDDSSKL